ncbi:hypothetical protein BJ508DRAFT_374608 [Ascobolus immersus RN42]|uniref:CBM1 domain-containing protein n=1 Tax=Ascobolus immersus RN42 TaxID=1160509 RepID=A0A3N4ID14_ASCIM|nr:hypothetical protein BJ508DRAFT_374608 [Ascobolus immersus RN42]
MKLSTLLTLLAIASTTYAIAIPTQQSAYGQCGGKEYKGSKDCVKGYSCVYQNDYYSQCVPTPKQPVYPPKETKPVHPPKETKPVHPPKETKPVHPPVDTYYPTPPKATKPVPPPVDTYYPTPPKETYYPTPPKETYPSTPPKQTPHPTHPKETSPPTPPKESFASLTIFYNPHTSNIFSPAVSIDQDFVPINTPFNLGCQFDSCEAHPQNPAGGVGIHTEGVSCRFYEKGTDKTGTGICGGKSQCVTGGTAKFTVVNPECVYCTYGSRC